MSDAAKHKFGLLEVVVLLAIGCILLGLLVPSVSTRCNRRRSQCSNNLKQLALAAVNYEFTHQQFPGYLHLFGRWQPNAQAEFRDPSDLGNTIDTAHWKIGGWHIALLPYLDAQATYEHWTDDRFPILASEETTNPLADGYHAFSAPNLPIYICPNFEMKPGNGANHYVSNNGLFDSPNPASNESGLTFADLSWSANGIFNNKLPPFHVVEDQQIPLALDAEFTSVGPPVVVDDIADGPSNTIMFAESHFASPYHHVSRRQMDLGQSAGLVLVEPEKYLEIASAKCLNGMVYTWTDDPNFSLSSESSVLQSRLGSPAKLARPSSAHPSGFNAAYADGQVRFVEDSIDAKTYRQLLTPNDRASSVARGELATD